MNRICVDNVLRGWSYSDSELRIKPKMTPIVHTTTRDAAKFEYIKKRLHNTNWTPADSPVVPFTDAISYPGRKMTLTCSTYQGQW